MPTDLLSGPSELTEYLLVRPEGALVVWGAWPPQTSDGNNVITVLLVDADGVRRPHPH